LLLADGSLLFLGLPVIVIAASVLFRSPWNAVVVWFLVLPYFVRKPLFAGPILFWGLHRVMIVTALGIALLQIGAKARRTIKWHPGEIGMILFLTLLAVDILLSPNRFESLLGFFDRLVVPFAMYFLVRVCAPGDKDLERFVPVALVTTVIQAAIGIISWFSPGTLPAWRDLEGLRVVGSFLNPAVYTSTLIFLSIFLLNYATTRLRGWFETVCLLTVGLAFFCVFLSFSRGSWLGGAFVVLGLSFLYPKLVGRSALLLVLVGLLASGLFSRELSWASQRLHQEASAENRVVGAAASLRMAAAKPWFGWGYNRYDEYFLPFKQSTAGIPVRSEIGSHNTYLTLLAENGVIGLGLYLFPIGWLLVRSIRVWRFLPPQNTFQNRRWLALLWLYVLDHFVVTSFMDMIRYHVFGTTVLWLALGLIACLVYPSRTGGQSDYQP